MTKVVKVYVESDDGKLKWSSPNFNVEYNKPEDLIEVLRDLYKTLYDVVIIGDIYINEPFFNKNGELDYEEPIVSWSEVRNDTIHLGQHYHNATGKKYEVGSIKNEPSVITYDFIDVVDLALNEPARFAYPHDYFVIDDIYRVPTIIYNDVYGTRWMKCTYPNVVVTYPVPMFYDMRKYFEDGDAMRKYFEEEFS